MPRPKNASYRSHRIIHDALLGGPRYFKELVDVTRLHRNTTNSRLDFLISEGLVQKKRKGNKVFYHIIEPLTDGTHRLRREGLKWMKHILDPAEERQVKRDLRRALKEQIENRKMIDDVSAEISRFYQNLDELIDCQESQELLDHIENWEEIPVTRLWLVLDLNKVLCDLGSHKQICPLCHHFGTITDEEANEIACERCGYVIGDETLSPEERLNLIQTFIGNPV